MSLSVNRFCSFPVQILVLVSKVRLRLETSQLNEAKSWEKFIGTFSKYNMKEYAHKDLIARKGFMHEVKEDINILFIFLSLVNARLHIVVDDLDRCKEDEVMDVLAVMNSAKIHYSMHQTANDAIIATYNHYPMLFS